MDSHMPMRVSRRTCASSPRPRALATIGMTAWANPEPRMKTTKKLDAPNTPAASAATEYQPSMIVSTTCSDICARWLPISGRPSVSVARAWAA